MKKLLLVSLCFLLLFVSRTFAQSRTVTGTVRGQDDGLPLPGVTIRVQGSNINGTQSNANGQFTLKVEKGNVLTFSFIGYTTQTVTVADEATLNVVLSTASRELGQVVVTGYQTKTRADVAAAISVVGGKEVADRPIPTVDNLLQGKAAGVQIVNQNGRPGSNAFIRVRGTGSITAGSQPLLVVDGVQIPDNTAGDFYNTLNANDIQSISVLKDAAAVSIYGARGSNGVVVITTKTGGETQPQITYSFQYGTSRKIPDNFKMMTPAQKLQYEYDLGYENSDFSSYLTSNGFPANATLFSITDAQRQAGWNSLIAQSHNWQDDILQNAKILQHQVSISGHANKTNYYLSFQKFDQDGITVGSKFSRYVGKINLSTEIKPWLSVSNNLNIGQKTTNEPRDLYNAQNPFAAMYLYNPYEKAYNADGSYNFTSQGFPILEALQTNTDIRHTINGYNATTLDFHPIKGLNVSSTIGLTYNNYKREYYIKPGSILDSFVGDPTAPGSKTDNGSDEFQYDWVNKAIYRFTVKDDHHFNILAVQEFQKDQASAYSLSKKGFSTGDLSTQDNGAANTGTNTTSKASWTLASLLGEADYNYKEKYYLTGSFRRDGSSRFGSNVKYGNFYAVSASWLLTQEDFLKSVEWLNVLKLRGSIGTSGNFQIGNYQSLGLYGFGKYNNLLTEVPTQIANPNLTWEKKLKRDIGFDFEFLKSRISGSIEYYNEKTSALLLNVPVSQTTGFSSVIKNSAEMYNKGIDASLNIDIVRNKDWNWSVFGNINYNKNEVTKLYDGSNETVITGYGVAKPGYALNTFKLVRYAGVDPQTGEAQYYDKNGNITKTYSSDDAVVLKGKSPTPKFFGGFGTTVSYKGVSLTGNFTYTIGNYVFNAQKEILDSWGDEVYINQAVDALNYWKKPGDVNVLPKASVDNVTYDTDLYLQNASYIRLRELTLAYTIPKAITQRFKVQSLRIFGTAQNLFIINPHHFFGDPEVGYGSAENGYTTQGQITLFTYPNTRQFTFGLNLTF